MRQLGAESSKTLPAKWLDTEEGDEGSTIEREKD